MKGERIRTYEYCYNTFLFSFTNSFQRNCWIQKKWKLFYFFEWRQWSWMDWWAAPSLNFQLVAGDWLCVAGPSHSNPTPIAFLLLISFISSSLSSTTSKRQSQWNEMNLLIHGVEFGCGRGALALITACGAKERQALREQEEREKKKREKRRERPCAAYYKSSEWMKKEIKFLI